MLARTLENPTLGIYVQVPFCASKCTFCNFSSSVERNTLLQNYSRSLEQEVNHLASFYAERGIPREVLGLPLDSVYFGGGTPTLLGPDRLRSLVEVLRRHFKWSSDVEFTLETTPGSVDANFLYALRSFGVNRLSVGAQTFADAELRAAGRLHSADDTGELVALARAAGIRNLSLDLIAGLPLQTEASFRYSLEATARLRPEHVSLYIFEIDEKSRLGREVVHGGKRYQAAAVPSEDFMADAYETGREFLAREGYVQYEISNFALAGFQSRHNQKYWRLEPYLGLGAGAHSFDGSRRWANRTSARDYLATLETGASALVELHIVTPTEQIEEFFFLGLRQTDGLDLDRARQRWGPGPLKPWEEKIRSLARDCRIIVEGDRVRLPPNACLVSNEILQEFVSLPL